jgi:alpha,alpha-trehalase
MMKRVYAKLIEKPSFTKEIAKRWIINGIKAGIKELLGVWLAAPRIDPRTGMSTYHTEGIGIPPETEGSYIFNLASHFDHILKPYSEKYQLDIETFAEKYQKREIIDPSLDEYFVHDRAVRESGHDTTYRFEKRCANLATVDLNSLLVRYERDLGDLIREHCNGL